MRIAYYDGSSIFKDIYGEDFPSETFRVPKEKETRLHGEYHTKRLVLEAWEELHDVIVEVPGDGYVAS